MKALLYISLLAENQPVNYSNAVLEQVKKQFPEVAVLDIDSKSDQLVLHYAKQMLQIADQLIVCIDGATSDAGFGSIFSLVELLLENPKEQLILFRNEHTRLQRMVQARPELKSVLVNSEDELLEQVKVFLSRL